ncbi:hypothetical protein [Nannocystis sp. SCPEA4]|uniref:hypothetical protein n=1 Tax=Nannocystis sp. SCPEA4 TaxID=2996787 RepID=UPI0022705A4A|nr:hypothetical protein [Nannocystis sp. SCPEA4]MCY1059325.1 hypothetical protein [Nannocystis sp. SCPEA4]
MLLRSTFAGLLAVAQAPEPSPPADNTAIAWRAPASCPARGALLRSIETRLGRPVGAGELAIDGVVTAHASPPRYRLRLRLRAGGPAESRTLTAATCAALVDATALLAVTALKTHAPEPAPAPTGPASPPRPPRREPAGAGGSTEVEAGATEAGVEPSGATETGATPPTETGAAPPAEASATSASDASSLGPEGASVPEVAVVEPEDVPAEGPTPADVPMSAPPEGRTSEIVPAESPGPRRAPGGFLRLQGGPDVGALPRVITGAVGLAGGLLWRRARLELQGVYLAPRTAEAIHGELRGELQVQLAAASALGCARLGRGRLEVPLCGGLELGNMRGRARGLPEARTATNLWLAVVASAGVAVRLGERWSLGAALQLVTEIVRPGFQLRDPGREVPLFTPAPVTGRLLFGVELRLRDPR